MIIGCPDPDPQTFAFSTTTFDPPRIEEEVSYRARSVFDESRRAYVSAENQRSPRVWIRSSCGCATEPRALYDSIHQEWINYKKICRGCFEAKVARQRAEFPYTLKKK